MSERDARGQRGDVARELADAMPHIVWTSDTKGGLTYVNRRWAEYTGLDLEATLRAGAESLIHPDDREMVRDVFLRAMAAGETFTTLYRLRRGSDGAFRWHEARVGPLQLQGGRAVSFVGTAVDVDDERRTDQQHRFLSEAGKVLGTSLEPHKTLSDVARMVVPHLADWCAVDLLAEDGTHFERVAVAHVDPAKVALAHRIWQLVPPRPKDPTGVAAVVRTGRAELLEDIPDALLVQSIPDPELLGLMRDLGLKSSMCVPLTTRGRTLGGLTLVAAESGRHFGPEDLVFAEDFAGRIAVALDNARLYTEVQVARRTAEALAADVVEQNRAVEAALLHMRAERDAALEELEARGPGRA